MANVYDIIIRPIITERSMEATADKKYVFEVAPTAGKIEIKNVTGPLSISVKGVKKGYFEVVLNLANLTSSPASFEPQAKHTKIELTLKPSCSAVSLRGTKTRTSPLAALPLMLRL